MACIDSSAREIIPIFFAFDNNYAIPAGVAFYSLMTFASKKYDYKFIVLHEDITEDNQSSLFKTLASFDNVSLEFRYMGDQFKDEWDGLTVKGHYTKECLYKLIPVNYFMEYDRIIWSDVDVLFKDDISDIYFMLSSDNYLAGVRVCGKLDRHYELMDMPVCVKEILKNGIAAGILVYNLKKMREDNVVQLIMKTFEDYKDIITQPEQDILNISLNGRIDFLPIRYCFCTYMYNLFRNKYKMNLKVKGGLIN